jgi:cytochrome c oxidase assembly protein Cox11
MLNPKEELYLPIYFYLEPEINDDRLLKNTNEINIVYKLNTHFNYLNAKNKFFNDFNSI